MAKVKKPKPRTRSDASEEREGLKGGYSYKLHGVKNSYVPEGDLTLKRNVSGISVCRPDWNGGYTVFRALPMVGKSSKDPSKKIFTGYRNSVQPADFKDFIRSYPVAAMVGLENRFTFFLNNKGEDPDYQMKQNPYVLLRAAVDREINERRAPREWDIFVKGLPGKGATMSRAAQFTLLQGLLYKKGKNVYIKGGTPPRGANDRDMMQLIQLKNSAGRALVNALNEVKPGYEDTNETDWEKVMVHGNPLALNGGRFINIYNPKLNEFATEADVTGGIDWSRKSTAGGGDDDGDFGGGFETMLTETYLRNGQPTQITPAVPKEIQAALLNKVQPWDNILNFPGDEEQAEIIARAFPLRKLLEFAWQGRRELLTESVMNILKKSTYSLPTAGEQADAELGTGGNSTSRSRTALLDDGKEGKPVANKRGRKQDDDLEEEFEEEVDELEDEDVEELEDEDEVEEEEELEDEGEEEDDAEDLEDEEEEEEVAEASELEDEEEVEEASELEDDEVEDEEEELEDEVEEEEEDLEDDEELDDEEEPELDDEQQAAIDAAKKKSAKRAPAPAPAPVKKKKKAAPAPAPAPAPVKPAKKKAVKTVPASAPAKGAAKPTGRPSAASVAPAKAPAAATPVKKKKGIKKR